MKNKDKIAKKRIQLGIQFLDAQIPFWESQIEVDTLDLRTNECVLGQIFGCFNDALTELGLHPRIATQMGFERSNTISDKRLTRIWLKIIKERLERSKLPDVFKKTTLKKSLPKKIVKKT